MDTILRAPQWPVGLSNFVTWCLMWDPRNRPTSAQALSHEYFADAVDPLRPKSSTSRLLGRKHSTIESKVQRDANDSPPLSAKSSWFRKSFIKDNAPVAPPHLTNPTKVSPRPTAVHASTMHTNVPTEHSSSTKLRPFANKRATWTNGAAGHAGAPMPILPSIRPISPFSATVTAQAHTAAVDPSSATLQHNTPTDAKGSKKIGRQLSVASHGNHYGDPHRQEAERALNGQRDVTSPNGTQKESFFSHLRKRARRLSGRPSAPVSPAPEDVEANAGCGGPWHSNRSSMAVDPNTMDTVMKKNNSEVDKALQHVRQSAEASSPPPHGQSAYNMNYGYPTPASSVNLERHPSVSSQVSSGPANNTGAISSRTRRALQLSTHPSNSFETPDEEDELLQEALHSTQKAARGIDHSKVSQTATPPPAATDKLMHRAPHQPSDSPTTMNPYPTPSPSAKGTGIMFSPNSIYEPSSPLNIQRTRPKEESHPKCAPTPPPDENEWAASAAASIFAAGSLYH